MKRALLVTSIVSLLVVATVRAVIAQDTGSTPSVAAESSRPSATVFQPLYDPLPSEEALAAMPPAQRQALFDAVARWLKRRQQPMPISQQGGVEVCLAGSPCALGKTLSTQPPCTGAEGCAAYELWREGNQGPDLEIVPALPEAPERHVRPASKERDDDQPKP